MAIFYNLCVPGERDLRFGSTGSNYNSRNTLMYSCGYDFRLPPLKVRDLRLDLAKKFIVFVQTLTNIEGEKQ
jgi:hypothetical protein